MNLIEEHSVEDLPFDLLLYLEYSPLGEHIKKILPKDVDAKQFLNSCVNAGDNGMEIIRTLVMISLAGQNIDS